MKLTKFTTQTAQDELSLQIHTRITNCIGNMSISAFARKADIAPSTLHSALHGTNLSLEVAQKIAAAANVSLDWLATGCNPTQAPQISTATSTTAATPVANVNLSVLHAKYLITRTLRSALDVFRREIPAFYDTKDEYLDFLAAQMTHQTIEQNNNIFGFDGDDTPKIAKQS